MSFFSWLFTNESLGEPLHQYLNPAQNEIVKYTDQINGTRQNSVPNPAMEQEDGLDLEMKRPPYLHVRHQLSVRTLD